MPNTIDEYLKIEHLKYDNKYVIDYRELRRKDLKIGLSAFIRVRNEGHLLSSNIDSIIDYLDELVIVYNCCVDNTEKIVKKYQKKYSSKIKVYNYVPEVYPARTLQHALTHPRSPHSLVNYSNYALSKTTYKYVLKHDADHFTFNNFIQIRSALLAKRNIINSAKSLLSLGIVNFQYIISGFNANHYRLGSSKWRQLVSNCKIYYEVYKYRDMKKLALSGINIGYIANQYYLFDSYATVGHGDYGITLRCKTEFCWSPNYEEDVVFKDYRTVFVAFTFWHARYIKRNGIWKEFGRKYKSFFDPNNVYVPWWEEYPITVPDLNKIGFDKNLYINVPKRNKIPISELQTNWHLVHEKMGISNFGESNISIFFGIDYLPNPKSYQSVREYIINNKVRPKKMTNLPFVNFGLQLLVLPYLMSKRIYLYMSNHK